MWPKVPNELSCLFPKRDTPSANFQVMTWLPCKYVIIFKQGQTSSAGIGGHCCPFLGETDGDGSTSCLACLLQTHGQGEAYGSTVRVIFLDEFVLLGSPYWVFDHFTVEAAYHGPLVMGIVQPTSSYLR